MNSTAMRNSRCNASSNSSTWAWIVTSSAVVGSSAMRRLGRQAKAMAINARCRWPPESSCGKAARALFGILDGGLRKELDGTHIGKLGAHRIVRNEDLGNLVADRVERIERGHRLLKDHCDPAATQSTHLAFAFLQQILALEANRALAARSASKP